MSKTQKLSVAQLENRLEDLRNKLATKEEDIRTLADELDIMEHRAEECEAAIVEMNGWLPRDFEPTALTRHTIRVTLSRASRRRPRPLSEAGEAHTQ